MISTTVRSSIIILWNWYSDLILHHTPEKWKSATVALLLKWHVENTWYRKFWREVKKQVARQRYFRTLLKRHKANKENNDCHTFQSEVLSSLDKRKARNSFLTKPSKYLKIEHHIHYCLAASCWNDHGHHDDDDMHRHQLGMPHNWWQILLTNFVKFA